MNIASITPKMIGDLARRGHERLAPFRTARKAAYQAFVGRHYGAAHVHNSVVGNRARDSAPVNLTAQQVRTLLSTLAYTCGDPEIDANFSELAFEAKLIKVFMQQEHQRLRLDDAMQTAIVDAILSGVHIRKIGLKAGDTVLVDGTTQVDNGQTFDEPVDFDDYFDDPDARREAERRIEGHSYRCSRSAILEAGLFGKMPGESPSPFVATPEEAAQIVSDLRAVNAGSNRGGRVSDASNNKPAGTSADSDTIELWDCIWYGAEGKAWIFTVAMNPDGNPSRVVGDKFLNCFQWDGYDRGPLEKLWFIPVPNNIMPLSLEALQRDLAMVADALANKLIAQMLRAKSLPIAKAGHADLGVQAAKAPDGKMLTGDPATVGVVEFRAQLDQLIPGMQWTMEQWNNTTGNLQLASGQGDVTETATEFAGLAGRVAGWLQFLQQRVEGFSSRCLKRRAHYFISDPMVNQIVPYQTPMGTIRVPYDLAMRSGAFEDFSFRMRSYPAEAADPAIRMKRLVEVFTGVLPAVLQLAMQGVVDPSKAIRLVAERFNVPELETIVNDPQTMMQMMAMQALGPAPGGPMPSQKAAAGKQAEMAGPVTPGGPMTQRPIGLMQGAMAGAGT